MQIKHKAIAESKNLTIRVTGLIDFINNQSDDVVSKPKPVHKNGKSRKEGGERITIETVYRRNAEKRYRQQVRRQLQRAVNNLTDDVVVENIAFCQPWDWRW